MVTLDSDESHFIFVRIVALVQCTNNNSKGKATRHDVKLLHGCVWALQTATSVVSI